MNIKGLRRRDFTSTDIAELKKAYKLIYRSGLTTNNAIEEIRGMEWESAHISSLVEFFGHSKRGVIR